MTATDIITFCWCGAYWEHSHDTPPAAITAFTDNATAVMDLPSWHELQRHVDAAQRRRANTGNIWQL